ncbi:MAG: DPP IV N-terminal domain-containing protein, partial [Candidatus Saccharimonadales bacterium]
DSNTLVACRVEPATTKDVYLIESSPAAGGRAKLRTMPYGQPGDKMPRYELWLFDPQAKIARQAEMEPIDFQGPPRPHWLADGRRFTLERTDRGHQRFRVIEVDARTGQTRNLIDQRSPTFINGVGQIVRYLDKTNEIVWSSERDGWNHLYLVNGDSGELRSITQGPWVVRGIERIDEETRQVWFRASGMHGGQDPYLVHYYRIGLDGTGLTPLTPCDGNHAVQFSPDRTWLIDSYSRVDQPPIHELRRAADGSLVCELERADVSTLVESGWQPPEVFCSKGRDGVTDIWGVVCRPRALDPNRKYPVIENIYAGPQDSHVPKSFSAHQRMQSLAELGFIVVQIDGMGTANRSKAFHDVCWKNLADAGLPDRIAWIKALAARYAYVDAERVGIYGTSAGGQ